MKKTSEIKVKISPELKEKIKKMSNSLGVSESDYIRSLLIEDLKNGN